MIEIYIWGGGLHNTISNIYSAGWLLCNSPSELSPPHHCCRPSLSLSSSSSAAKYLCPQNIYRRVRRHCHRHCCCVVVIVLVIVITIVIVHRHCTHPCQRHRHSLVNCYVIGGMDTSSCLFVVCSSFVCRSFIIRSSFVLVVRSSFVRS